MAPQSGKNMEIAKAIGGCESICIHVRRGDYVIDAKTNQHHGICSLDYYYRCASAVAERTKDPHFFVFTDDPLWVREHLKLQYPMTFVDQNGSREAYEDIRLMSQCRHHIIANSSFSWWGAWLGTSPENIVFAPKQWFAKKSNQDEVNDIVPERWIKI